MILPAGTVAGDQFGNWFPIGLFSVDMCSNKRKKSPNGRLKASIHSRLDFRSKKVVPYAESLIVVVYAENCLSEHKLPQLPLVS